MGSEYMKSKILLHELYNRIKKTIEEELYNAQTGFQEGENTAGLICNLQMLSDMCIEFQQPLPSYLYSSD